MADAITHPRLRNLITGVTGFAGCYLADALSARGEVVVGLSRRALWPAGWSHLAARIDLRECDLCNAAAVEAILRETRPERIYHLAGFARVGESFRDTEAVWSGNLTTTLRLCEAVIRCELRPRILFVGSGAVYGNPDNPEAPRNEELALRPDTPYAASKAAADLACYQYTCTPGLDIVRARPFNHVGPLQSADYAIPHFAQQLVAIERGEALPVLHTGNLCTQRDFTDVRDMVKAYMLLMEHGRCGEAYNIGTGQTWSMQTIVERLVSLVSLRVEIRQATELLRPTEQSVVWVDASKIQRETSWKPAYSLDQTLRDTLAAWRQQH